MDFVPLNWQETVTADMLEDWLYDLQNRNREAMMNKRIRTKKGISVSPIVVKFIFVICRRLNMPAPVHYLTVEIYDRFMERHQEELYQYITTNISVKNRREEWSNLLARVKRQTTLRILSCTQLASKVVAHYKILTPLCIRNFLKQLGHNYQLKGIISSEMRVLKALNYTVTDSSPLMYLETLMMTQRTEVKTEEFYATCIKLLDLAYLCHEQLYQRLFSSAAGREIKSDKDREIFMSVECDHMYLSAGILAAGSYLMCPHFTRDILTILEKNTGVLVTDIALLATILLELGLD